jgi:hypothetical protein
MGTAERMNSTLETIARTVLLASGMDKRWWHHAILYANTIHNVQYSRVTKSSPHLMMFNEKPDVSGFQQFGGEAWLHRGTIENGIFTGTDTPLGKDPDYPSILKAVERAT